MNPALATLITASAVVLSPIESDPSLRCGPGLSVPGLPDDSRIAMVDDSVHVLSDIRERTFEGGETWLVCWDPESGEFLIGPFESEPGSGKGRIVMVASGQHVQPLRRVLEQVVTAQMAHREVNGRFAADLSELDALTEADLSMELVADGWVARATNDRVRCELDSARLGPDMETVENAVTCLPNTDAAAARALQAFWAAALERENGR